MSHGGHVSFSNTPSPPRTNWTNNCLCRRRRRRRGRTYTAASASRDPLRLNDRRRERRRRRRRRTTTTTTHVHQFIIRTTTPLPLTRPVEYHAPTVLPVPSYTIGRVCRLVVSRAPSPRFSAMNKPLPPPPRYPSHLFNYNMRRRSVTYRYCPSAGKCL